MSASNVRLYQIVKKSDPKQMLDIKGLAVKEREFVVSNIEASDEWKEEVKTLADENARKTFFWQPENTKTEADIKEHFANLLGDTLIVRDAVKGIDLTAFVETVTVTPAAPTTGVNSTVQFSASVAPELAQQEVNWTIANQAGLTIDANGLVTVGAAVPLGNYIVTATSKFNAAKTGTATLTVV